MSLIVRPNDRGPMYGNLGLIGRSSTVGSQQNNPGGEEVSSQPIID